MFDAYGDGWNGNVLTIGDQTFELDTATDGGSSDTACYENEAGDGWDNDVVVTCGGGSWQSEVSWQIYDWTGTVVLEGTCPFEGCLGTCDDGGGDDCDANSVNLTVDGGSWQSEISWEFAGTTGGAPSSTDLCLEDGTYDFVGCDSYGDGWNGNVLTIGDQTFAPASGNPCEEVCASGGSDLAVTCDGGSWQSEVSWSILDADGNGVLDKDEFSDWVIGKIHADEDERRQLALSNRHLYRFFEAMEVTLKMQLAGIGPFEENPYADSKAGATRDGSKTY